MQWKILGRVFYLSKTAVILLTTLAAVGLLIGGYFLLPQTEGEVVWEAVSSKDNGQQNTTKDITTPTASPPPTQAVLWRIYIVGAVNNPGLYTLQEGVLLYDAVEAAGGLLQSAEPDTVNLAQELQDNLMIRILTKEERRAQERSSGVVFTKNNVEIGGEALKETHSATMDNKININIASKEELMQLSGIGEAKAESIIAYRETNGPFQNIEDIMLVSGIKESGFAKIKDRITT